MIYVFLEGNPKGSECTFWNQVNRELYNNKLKIVGCGGVLKMLNTIKSMNLTSQDLGIVYIDKNWEQDDDPLRELINDLIIYCGLQDNLFLCANTAGFEDILLHFTYLETYLYSVNYRETFLVKNVWKDHETYLSNWKNLEIEDKDENNKNIIVKITDFYTKRGKKPTKEKAAYIVLNKLVNIIPNNGFEVTKGHLGQCWYCNCKNKSECLNYVIVKNKVIRKNNNNDDKCCGLMKNQKITHEKVKQIYTYTIINDNMLEIKDYCKRLNIQEEQNLRYLNRK